ncbi:MAG: hypothetical protein IJM83_02955 [Firmicutes bacterium]|nr:hypothetical protein [Bacillota bacterium]
MYDRPILAIIRENLFSEGRLPRDFSLPKDPDDESSFLFADGAQDGIIYFHTQPGKLNDEEADLLVDALNAMLGGHIDTADELFLKLTKTRRVLEFGGALCDIVEENVDRINPIHAYSYGMHLITMAKDKELVKIGLVLHHKATEDHLKGFKQIITDLAYCNEFTWFCLPIIQKWDGGNDLIFEIAKHVYGWGRVHACVFLEPETWEIKQWFLTEGVDNGVIPPYTALETWNKSDAASLLDCRLSQEGFTCISRIMAALLDEVPCRGISLVEEPETAIHKFLNQAKSFKLSPDDYKVIETIEKRWDRDELIASLCEDLLYR